MTTMQSIDSDDLSLGEVFNGFFVVPNYQREFVWEESQVLKLLSDIYEEFTAEAESDYFIGSIVVSQTEDTRYELIDGQQRMTTSFLILCAIRDRLERLGNEPLAELNSRIRAASVNTEGTELHRIRVELQYPDSGEILTLISNREDLSEVRETTRSIKNIVDAYETAESFLGEYFHEDARRLRQFYAYFTQKVKLIRIRATTVRRAFKVFETINDRGVTLDSMDLLKNLLFMEAEPKAFDRLSNTWKEMADTLFNAKEKPLRFLRYYILSTYDEVGRIREDQVYEWFSGKNGPSDYRRDPVGFAQGLLEAAQDYSNFIAGNTASGSSNRYLKNIRLLSGATRLHLILLLAGRKLPSDQFIELSRHLENLFFAYIITREDFRALEPRFAAWSKSLREVKNKAGLESFIEEYIQPAKADLSVRFEQALDVLEESSLQKYRLKYVLAKLAQSVNETAWGSDAPHSDLSTYINRVQIEHVLPQDPSEASAGAFAKNEELDKSIHRLGNLTLLEGSLNASAGNKPFDEKQQAYSQSSFLLTRILGGPVVVGKDTKIDRAVKGLPIPMSWNPTALDDRHAAYKSLAFKVWDMPPQ